MEHFGIKSLQKISKMRLDLSFFSNRVFFVIVIILQKTGKENVYFWLFIGWPKNGQFWVSTCSISISRQRIRISSNFMKILWKKYRIKKLEKQKFPRNS